ncbi:hypothetical protein, partial [Vibrio aestuarianus]|uniref:hypothetical protein n=1 Tax=Vibrio aestuarianus TaxID=28171 RepID=UPI001B34C271
MGKNLNPKGENPKNLLIWGGQPPKKPFFKKKIYNFSRGVGLKRKISPFFANTKKKPQNPSLPRQKKKKTRGGGK